MYKIGDFSKLSKTTIKTLRYYEKEGLLMPYYVDDITGYRYYNTSQLIDIAHIISLRQIGLSIEDIKKTNNSDIKDILKKRQLEINESINNYEDQLSRINCLLEVENMKYEVIIKELPEFTVYYKEGIISDFSKINEFILSSAEECMSTNPNIKCIEPDYCYVNYLDGEYKEKDIKIRYAQAVVEEGIPNETIKFEKLKPMNAACIYHKGTYDSLPDIYAYLIKWIEENGYEVIESPREHYIDGIWNKEDQNDWLTEIQIPVKKK